MKWIRRIYEWQIDNCDDLAAVGILGMELILVIMLVVCAIEVSQWVMSLGYF